MKLLMVSLLMSPAAMASNNYICEYQLREKITLTVLNGNTLTIDSNRFTSPAVNPILDKYETIQTATFSGNLGSPWMAGTRFVLKVQKGSSLGLYTVIGSTGRAVDITTKCQSF